MKILFVDQFSDPGGAQLAMEDVIEEARRRGWTCSVLAPGAGLPLRPLTRGAKNGADLLRYIGDVPGVRRAIRTNAYDLLYVNGPRVLPAVVGLDVPVIFHAHSVVTGRGSRMLTSWAARASRATVIAASQFAAEALGVPGARIVYNGAPDFGGLRKATPMVRVGIVGRVAPEKGHDAFIHAAQQLAGEAAFTVFGDRKPAGETVAFEGWRQDVGSIYAELDILVVPSGPNEVSTRVIMEAFSAGVTVVAYPSGGIPEVVTHDKTGLLVSPQQLAEAIRTLIESPELRSRLAANARLEWQRRFTRAGFQTRICDIIEATCLDHAPTDVPETEHRRGSTRSASAGPQAPSGSRHLTDRPASAIPADRAS